TPREADICRTVRFPPRPTVPVQAAVSGTTTSFVKPAAAHPAVDDDPVTAAMRRPMMVANGPPAMTADRFAAAISAVLLFGAGVVIAAEQLALFESGSWFSLAFPR